MITEPWVTASDIAQPLGVAKDTVYRWRKHKGKVCPHTKSVDYGNSSYPKWMNGCVLVAQMIMWTETEAYDLKP